MYATFGSKRAILAELVDQATFGDEYEELIRQALEATAPAAHLRLVARLARRIYDSERAELDLLRGAGVVAPELAALTEGKEELRFERQAPSVSLLAETGQLRPGLDADQARAIMWVLTARDLYRMLVVARGWDPERYEEWLAELLMSSLIDPTAAQACATSSG